MNKLYILLALLTFANSSNAVSRFDPILKEIIKYQEFEMEARELTAKNQNENVVVKKAIYSYKNFKDIEKNKNKTVDELIDELYNLAKKLQLNEISGSDFLEFLLNKRLLNSIFGRASQIEVKNDSYLRIPPLDEILFELWNKKDHDELIKYNKEVRIENINRYQFNIILIKKTFEILSIDELNSSAIEALRASPSIWPILQNLTSDLGHQDQSGGYIKVKNYMDFFQCDIPNAIARIILNKHCPIWEKNKRNYDVYWCESHFISKKRFIQSKMLGAPIGSGVTIELTDYENGDCSDDLPYPDFLKVQPEHPFMEFPIFFDTFNFDLLEDEIETPENATPQPVEQLIEPKNIGSNTNNLEQTDTSEEKPEDIIDHSEPTSKIDNEIIDEGYLAPSGIRKFHNLMPESPYPALSLKKKDQKFVDRIFNSKTSHTISFGEFKNFWKKMDGQIIEETGSSHKQLIGPKGDALYGVSAHNDAHTYGKNTIKYFRAALYYIGCRPS